MSAVLLGDPKEWRGCAWLAMSVAVAALTWRLTERWEAGALAGILFMRAAA